MIVQSFTRYLTENDAGYAKLKSKKFRKIRYNESEQAIMENEEGAAIAGVSVYVEENPEMYDESYLKAFENIKSRSVYSDNNFEVFYSFSGAIRGDRKYGNSNWSARFLYEFLSAGFNGGERFIDTYLNRVFPSRPVYTDLEELVEGVNEGIRTKWNDGNLKGGQWAAFYRFQTAEMEYLKKKLASFSRAIREDIIMCLSIGLIPLNTSPSPATIKKRLSLGITSENSFYATSWLIRQIEVHVILANSGTGTLYYSDTYKGE